MTNDATPATSPAASAAPATDAARSRAFWRGAGWTAGQTFAGWMADLARLNRRPHVRRLRRLVKLSDGLEQLAREVLRRDGDKLTADMRADVLALYRAARGSALGSDMPPRERDYLGVLAAVADGRATAAPR